MSKKRNVYYVGGGKGGVGKSLASTALIYKLHKLGLNPTLVESDTLNPDVLKSHQTEIECLALDLDKKDGWIELVNLAANGSSKPIVVNSAARASKSAKQFSKILNQVSEELGVTSVGFWLINRHRDSLELLKEFMDDCPFNHMHVVRNLNFGEEEQFDLYNKSNLRQKIEELKGLSLNLPAMAHRVADQLYSNRLSISAAIKQLAIGNRAELLNWSHEACLEFGKVIK
jgi:cellulose biosynthesis protein BcsQ